MGLPRSQRLLARERNHGHCRRLCGAIREHFAVGVQKIIFVPYKYRPDQIETIAREIIPRLKSL